MSIGLFGNGSCSPRLIRSFVVREAESIPTLMHQIGFAERAAGLDAEVWHRFDLRNDADCGRLLAAAVDNVRLPNLAVDVPAP